MRISSVTTEPPRSVLLLLSLSYEFVFVSRCLVQTFCRLSSTVFSSPGAATVAYHHYVQLWTTPGREHYNCWLTSSDSSRSNSVLRILQDSGSRSVSFVSSRSLYMYFPPQSQHGLQKISLQLWKTLRERVPVTSLHLSRANTITSDESDEILQFFFLSFQNNFLKYRYLVFF